MWLADATPDVAGANLWLFLITCVTTAGGIWSTWLAIRRKGETAAAVDEALETQNRLIVQPIADERDEYRALWTECMKARLGGKPGD